MSKSRIYADYAAITPQDTRVLELVRKAEEQLWANPSAQYSEGYAARDALRQARAGCARLLQVRPAEILFTSGSTEAINLAIRGAVAGHNDPEVVASELEHPAVLATAADCGVLKHAYVQENGIVDVQAIANMITDRTVVVCVQYVNNELGTIQPIKEVAAIVELERERRRTKDIERPLYLFCDAAQAGLQTLSVRNLGVDLLSMGGSKLYGPRGVGMLFCREGVDLKPQLTGGGQERTRRAGTEHVAATIGFAKALELMQQDRAVETKRLQQLRGNVETALLRAIPGARINCEGEARAPHISSLTLPHGDGETLLAHLDALGVAAATGSACNAAHEEPSSVLQAIGLNAEEAKSTLRISFGRFSTASEGAELVERIEMAFNQVAALGKS